MHTFYLKLRDDVLLLLHLPDDFMEIKTFHPLLTFWVPKQSEEKKTREAFNFQKSEDSWHFKCLFVSEFKM